MVKPYKLTVIALALSFLVQFVSAEQLGLKLTGQEMDQWCWAATSQAIINYYGIEMTQTEIVTAVKGSAVNQPGQPDEMIKALNLGDCNAQAIQSPLPSESALRQMADEKHPAIMGYNRQHVVAYDGYTGDVGNAVYHIMDPWPVNSGEWKDWSWATVQNCQIGPWDLCVTTDRDIIGPETYTLTVVNGEGSGDYEEGEEVTISAAVPNGQIFVKWETTYGDIIDDEEQEETVVTMPGQDVTVTCTYDASSINSSHALVFKNGINTITANKMNFTVPVTGNYSVNVYSLNGEVISSMNQDFVMGSHSLQWNKSNIGSQMLFFEVKGGNQRYVTKSVVK